MIWDAWPLFYFKRLISTKGKLVFKLLFLFPIIASLLYVYFFGVNVVFWDQWGIVPFFDKYFHNTLTLHDLFIAYSNEHPIFFPEVVMLFLGVLSSYNNIVEMYFIQFLLLISLLVIFLAIKRQFFLSRLYYWFLPIPYILFSFRKFEIMLFGYEMTFLMALTFAILASYFLYIMGGNKNRITTIAYFTCAIVSTIVSSYSSVMGLFVWLSGLIEIATLPIEKNIKLRRMVIWSCVGSLAWLLYFSHYVRPLDHKFNILSIFYTPVYIIDFYFTTLGSSIFWHHNSALISGIFFFVILDYLMIKLYRNGRFKNNAFWISLAIFSLLTILCITIGRSFLGIGQAGMSRYTVFPSLTIIAIFMINLDVKLYENNLFISIIQYLIIGIIFLGICSSYSHGIKAGYETRATREKAAYILYHYESQNDELLKELYGHIEIVKEYAPILKKYNYNVFHR